MTEQRTLVNRLSVPRITLADRCSALLLAGIVIALFAVEALL